MTVRLPRPPVTKEPDVNRYFDDMTRALGQEFDKRTPDDTVRRSLFLKSPDDSIWEITVSNAGAFVATKVFG